MQTKHLCVLIHIRNKGEVAAPWNWLKPSSKRIFTVRSKAVLLLWIIFCCYASCWSVLWCLVLVASSKLFYWPFQGGTSFVDLLCFCSVLCLLCFVRVCLYVLCGHLLGKGWPLGSRLWCLLWVCHFPIGIQGQVWYLIVSIPDLCTITYFL